METGWEEKSMVSPVVQPATTPGASGFSKVLKTFSAEFRLPNIEYAKR